MPDKVVDDTTLIILSVLSIAFGIGALVAIFFYCSEESPAPEEPDAGKQKSSAPLSSQNSKVQFGPGSSSHQHVSQAGPSKPAKQALESVQEKSSQPPPPSKLDNRFGKLISKIVLDVDVDQPSKDDIDVSKYFDNLSSKNKKGKEGNLKSAKNDALVSHSKAKPLKKVSKKRGGGGGGKHKK